MEENTNTEPNLEKMVTDGVGFLINQKIEKEQNVIKQLEDWTHEYLIPVYGEQQGESMFEIYKGDPYTMREDIRKNKSRHINSLVKEVAKNPKNVAIGVNEAEARELVKDIMGNNKYKILKKSMEDNNEIREALAVQYDNEDWASLVVRADHSVIVDCARKELERMTSKEYEKTLYSIDETKKTISYSPEKFSNVITANIDNHPNPNALYKEIGLAYAKSKISSARQKI